MLSGRRDNIAKAAVLIALGILLGLFIFAWTIPHVRSVEQEAAQRSEIHRQNAEDRIRQVCSSPVAESDCVAETRQAQRENERQEYDLAAQRVTAWWTRVMGIAALIGMALSAVGVILVWTTFRETKRGAATAVQTYQAFIALERGRLSVKVDPILHSSGQLTINIAIQNVGRTKCICKELIISISNEHIYNKLDFAFKEIEKNVSSIDTYIPIWSTNIDPPLIDPMIVSGVVRYWSPLHDIHSTYFCVRVFPKRIGGFDSPKIVDYKGQDWPADT